MMMMTVVSVWVVTCLVVAVLVVEGLAVSGLHELSARDISGEDILLSRYAGKVLLVANVASECGVSRGHTHA